MAANISDSYILTSCDLMTPYGDLDLRQHWPGHWSVSEQHEYITWSNDDRSTLLQVMYATGSYFTGSVQEVYP